MAKKTRAPSPERVRAMGLRVVQPWLDHHAGRLDAVLTHVQVNDLADRVGYAISAAGRGSR